MSQRLKIGSYILDAAETSSTSNTTGCRLVTEKPGLNWSESRTGAQVRLFVQIARDTTANYVASRDALVNALTKTVNADIVFESAPGTTFKSWLVSTAAWSRVSCQVAEIDEYDTHGLALVIIDIERVAPATGSAGDPQGNLDGIRWDFALEVQGKAACTATGLFDTKANAKEWAKLMRSGAAWPDWINTTTARFVTPVYSYPQQPNQADPVPEEAYTPCQVTVLINMLPSAWAADTAFDNVIDGDCEMAVRSRARLPQEANAKPGLDVIISGRLQFKTEIDDTFDANDTTRSLPDSIDASARACFRVMKADLEARRGVTVELQDEIEFVPTGKTGEVSFVAIGVAEFGGIYEFSDQVIIRLEPRDGILEGTKGSVVFQDRLGPRLKARQVGACRANFQPTIAKPDFTQDGTWFEAYWQPSRPVVKPPHGEGPTIYEITWEGEWSKLSDGTRQPEGTQFGDLA